MSKPNERDHPFCSVKHCVDPIVTRHYAALIESVHAVLAVFGSMALAGRSKPLCLIFETASGYGKTAVLQMVFPEPESELAEFVYRSDKFTPKAFVSHAANVKENQRLKNDLLPKLADKVLVTKELAPIFRGREEEMQANFSVLISVLDGKGFTSDSGMCGQRAYAYPIIFNWIGATTPLPASTHRLMSQLGTRLLFYEVPAIIPTEEDLMAYALKDTASTAEDECRAAVTEFLEDFFRRHPVGSEPADSIKISEELTRDLVRWATFITGGRAEVKFERQGSNWEPVAAMPPEGPWKIINYLKDIARGHALIHTRTAVNACDLELVAHVAISSIPGHLRPIVRALMGSAKVNTPTAASLCRVTDPTARSYMKQMSLLGIADLVKGSARSNQPDSLGLSTAYRWLKPPP